MANRLNGDALRWIDALDRRGSLAQKGDGVLLERFLTRPGAAGEAALRAADARSASAATTAGTAGAATPGR